MIKIDLKLKLSSQHSINSANFNLLSSESLISNDQPKKSCGFWPSINTTKKGPPLAGHHHLFQSTYPQTLPCQV